MARKIMQGSYMDYIFLFGESRSFHTDMIAKALAEDGGICILWEDGMPAGYLMFSKSKTQKRVGISYVYTKEERRCRGICTDLVGHIVRNVPYSSLIITINEKNEFYQTIVHIAEKYGLKDSLACTTCRAPWESLRAWRYAYWDKFMEERGREYLRLFERQGFRLYSFEEAPRTYMEQLYDSHEAGSEFDNPMGVRMYFDGKSKESVKQDVSTVVAKDGKLAAYFLVTSPDGKNFIIEQSVVAKEYRHSGIIFMMLADFVESVGKYQCKNVALAVYDDNPHAISYVRKVIKNLKVDESRTYKLRLDVETGQ